MKNGSVRTRHSISPRVTLGQMNTTWAGGDIWVYRISPKAPTSPSSSLHERFDGKVPLVDLRRLTGRLLLHFTCKRAQTDRSKFSGCSFDEDPSKPARYSIGVFWMGLLKLAHAHRNRFWRVIPKGWCYGRALLPIRYAAGSMTLGSLLAGLFTLRLTGYASISSEG